MCEKTNKIGVALIDSRPLTRMSISHLLTTLSDDFVILSYPGIDEFVADYLEPPYKIEMILINLGAVRVSEHHISNGIQQLKHKHPDSPLVLLSDRDELADILDAIQIGVRGYISSTFNPAKIIHSLRLVISGGSIIPSKALLEIIEKATKPIAEERPNGGKVDPAVLRTFTSRQLEVFELMRQGKSNKFIAYELGMQECTVKVHVREIMAKLKATNRTHAAFLASQISSMEH
ncbi:response regulator transcription factor [Nitrosomonas sp. Nm34]|uniref:LuxR C-terminal-related transcriptional regulator n=1 Tax=Nitrosomonas sp. Nm34 TaxID=1881055 RepID=UPI0008F2007D|nr:response regulator transcription factor [Nitrosomonas sp. Nm34]SFI47446.1 DNA-binding response regulator, NarL/FixJ family, contains REC and HTH domains [Nitrosomonas sp. Nm34]